MTPDIFSDTTERNEPQVLGSLYQPQTPKLIEWTMRYSGGYVNDQVTATYVLMSFVMVAFVYVAISIFGNSERNHIAAPPGQRIIYSEGAPPMLEESTDNRR